MRVLHGIRRELNTRSAPGSSQATQAAGGCAHCSVSCQETWQRACSTLSSEDPRCALQAPSAAPISPGPCLAHPDFLHNVFRPRKGARTCMVSVISECHGPSPSLLSENFPPSDEMRPVLPSPFLRGGGWLHGEWAACRGDPGRGPGVFYL